MVAASNPHRTIKEGGLAGIGAPTSALAWGIAWMRQVGSPPTEQEEQRTMSDNAPSQPGKFVPGTGSPTPPPHKPFDAPRHPPANPLRPSDTNPMNPHEPPSREDGASG